MAENSWPFETQDTTELQYSKLHSVFANSGVVGGLALSVSAGMNVSLAVGDAIVRGFYYENTSSKVLAVPAAHATNTLKHYLVLKLDLSANTVVAVVKPGTTTLPALQQDDSVWEHPISVITVPPTTTNTLSNMLSPRLGGVGLRAVTYTTDEERPTETTGLTLGVNTATRKLELRVDAAWYTLNPDLSWAGISGKPIIFPTNWANVADKPSTFPPTIGPGATEAVAGNDGRLTNPRTPTAHTHPVTDITGIPEIRVTATPMTAGTPVGTLRFW